MDWSPSMLTYESPVYIKMVTPVCSVWSNQTIDIEYAKSILSCKRRLDNEFSLEGDDDHKYDERNDANKYLREDGTIYILEEGVRRSKRKMESMAKPRYFSHLKIDQDDIKNRETCMMRSDMKATKLVLRLKIPKKIY